MELALSRLKTLSPQLKVWGISATIGNMEQSLQILMGHNPTTKAKVIKAAIEKKVEVVSIFPDEVETLPWAGHLGIQLLDKVIPIVKESNSTLIFTNTRSFAEIWYQKILDQAPELSGLIAMHHGSISKELRDWVEDQLHAGKLKAVVCTSSLDLGVDFRPVETIIQVGSPKAWPGFYNAQVAVVISPGPLAGFIFYPPIHLNLRRQLPCAKR
jgi:ATP-dependent helicase Lhr and Lhr-like helicase